MWTSRKQRLAVAGVIVAAALGTLGGASVAAHRVGAAPAQRSATTQSSAPSSPAPSSSAGSLAGWTPGASSPVAPPTLPSRSLMPPTPSDPLPAGAVAPQLASDGIPAVALDAYRKAAAGVARTDPSCGLPWPLLAAIGRVESDHGRYGGSQLYSDGTSAPRIIGIALNGRGTALIRDTDHGVLDLDTVYDHAVGPMQFIPSTWRQWGVDGNGDGVISPFNIYDAALAAADYLCAAGGNLETAQGQIRAVLAYNDSAEYLATVLALEKIYASGAPGVTIPILPSNPMPPPHEKPLPPPVNPGPPLALTPRKATAKSLSGTTSRAGSGSGSAPGAAGVPGGPGPGVPGPGTQPGSRSGTGSAPSSPGTPTTPPATGGTSTPPPSGSSSSPPPSPPPSSGGTSSTAPSTPPPSTSASSTGSTSTTELTATSTPGGGPLDVTVSAPKSTTSGLTYTFDFGDKTTVGPQPEQTASHKYSSPGSYPVAVKVSDGHTYSATVTVSATGQVSISPASP